MRAAYELVKTHDRVGRMADTHEFFELRLPKAMFDNGLLERMLAIATQSVSVEGRKYCFITSMLNALCDRSIFISLNVPRLIAN